MMMMMMMMMIVTSWPWNQWHNNCPCRPCNGGGPRGSGGLVPTPNSCFLPCQ